MHAQKSELKREIETAEAERVSLDAQNAAQAASEAKLAAQLAERADALRASSLRRLRQQGTARAWSTWQQAFRETRRQRRLLLRVGARLTRPRLLAAYGSWRRSWTAAQAAAAAAQHEDALTRERALRRKLETELASALQVR